MLSFCFENPHMDATKNASLADDFNAQFAQLKSRVKYSSDALAQQHANALRRDAELLGALQEDALRLRSELVQLGEELQPQFNRLMQPTTNMMPRWPRQQQQQLSMRPTPSEQAAARRLQLVWQRRAPRASKTGDALHCPAWLREHFVRPHARARAPTATPTLDIAPAISPAPFPTAASLDAHKEGGDGEVSKHFMSLL